MQGDPRLRRTAGARLVAGDATLLGELASNLLDNAIRHGGPGQQVTLSLAAATAPFACMC